MCHVPYASTDEKYYVILHSSHLPSKKIGLSLFPTSPCHLLGLSSHPFDFTSYISSTINVNASFHGNFDISTIFFCILSTAQLYLTSSPICHILKNDIILHKKHQCNFFSKPFCISSLLFLLCNIPSWIYLLHNQLRPHNTESKRLFASGTSWTSSCLMNKCEPSWKINLMQSQCSFDGSYSLKGKFSTLMP